jgi:hypothetical protein
MNVSVFPVAVWHARGNPYNPPDSNQAESALEMPYSKKARAQFKSM